MTRLVWRNLTRNKRRTILTLLSVAFAVLLLTFLGALLQALTEVQSSTEASRLVVRNAISLTFDLPEAYGRRLETLEHVDAVTPLNWFQGIYKDTRPQNFFPRFSSDPDTLFAVFPEIELSEEEKARWASERNAFIAGRALVEDQGWQLGDTINIEGDIYPVDLELVLRGIYEDPENPAQERTLYFHRRYLEEALGNPGSVGTFWLRIDSPEAVPEVVAAIEALFENSESQVRAETEEAFALSFVQMLGNVRFLFGAIGLAIVVSILLITANTMAMAARERTREVAVLRTLGFKRGRVVSMVVAEALLVGVLGALLGLGLATLALNALGSGLEQAGLFLFQSVAVDTERLAVGIAIGLAIGLLAGLLPAWEAARRSIVDGLRGVG